MLYVLFLNIVDIEGRWCGPAPRKTQTHFPPLAFEVDAEVDSLVCPKCSGNKKVIAFIVNPDVIKRLMAR